MSNYLDFEEAEKIEKLAKDMAKGEKTARGEKRNDDELPNKAWLEREELRRIGRISMREGFYRVDRNEKNET